MSKEWYDHVTKQIISAAYEVSNHLGSGYLEKVYQNSLLIELAERGFKVDSEVEVKVFYKGSEVGLYFIDILVEDRIVLELKAVSCLGNAHKAQLLNYLHATKLNLGLLLNFGSSMFKFKELFVIILTNFF